MAPQKPPCFFFSYARKDHSPWLVRFFRELKERVAQKGQLDDQEGEVSFRDVDDIEPGMDWGTALQDALARCLTMVSVYTPWYFGRPYCGKEFRVLLDRQAVTYDTDGSARNSEKIVPVLWESMPDLKVQGLPPAVTKYVQWEPAAHRGLYAERGLRMLRVQKRAGAYSDILEELAGILILRAKQAPLPPLATPPSLGSTQNAFEKPNDSVNPEEFGPGFLLLVYLAGSPLEVPQARAERYGTGHPGAWRPFSIPNQDGLHPFVREAAAGLGFRRFREPSYDFGSAQVPAKILEDLCEATSRNVVAALVLDPWFPQSQRGKEILATILADDRWRGGLIVPVDAADQATLDLLPLVEPSWQVPEARLPSVTAVTARGTMESFQGSLVTLLTELRRRVTAGGDVPNPPTGSGPTSPPRLRSPGKKRD